MGVEYQHHFFVRDPLWVGDQAVLARVAALLDQWELVSGPPGVYDIDGGRKRKASGRLGAMKRPPANLLPEWRGVFGARGIERVMGPSEYPRLRAADRYFQRVYAVVGTDFRIFGSSEAFYVQVRQPAVENGQPVEGYDDFRRVPWACSQTFPAGPATR